MKRHLTTLFATLLAASAAVGQGSFCGAAGTPGSSAIAANHPSIAGWATGCTVVRGPVDITDPDGPKVRYGNEQAGAGPATGSTTDAVSLGDGGVAILTFDSPIRNIEGPDFAVFENSFNDRFLELAFVEVSTDGERYVRFPSTSETQTATQVGTNGFLDPTCLNNLAGKYRVGYGTPFDLEELRDSAGIDIDNIVYVRLVDVVGTIDPQYATRDAHGNMVNDPYPTSDTIWASGGFDLTGVAVLRPTAGIDDVEMVPAIGPNPTTGMLTVRGCDGMVATLCDMQGRTVQSIRCRMQTPIDMRGLPPGLYHLRVGGNTFKVVKM